MGSRLLDELVFLPFAAAFGRVLRALAFPWIAFGLLAFPLCGGHLLFFAAAKKSNRIGSQAANNGSRWKLLASGSILRA
ncbi:hypothetical protein, partial [Paraburkholderia nemoris]|uniref:hypothetical protein n=1 Tax=Paraburkholderia nemoris TaxID=2793076 RepID=UPI001B8BEFCF